MPARYRLALPAVLAAGALLFFAQLAGRSSVSEEFRWVQIAKEIEASGDYFRPTIHGKVYYDKPVGSYWLIVAAGAVRGGVDEAAARWPAALAGVAGLFLVVGLASRLYDRPTGLVAGMVLATCYGYAFYARRATADLETVTGVLAAVWLFERHRHRPRGNWVFGFWLVLATTSLTKGLLGFALPLVILGSYGTLNRLDTPSGRGKVGRFVEAVIDGNRWLFQGRTLLALPLAVGLYLAPFVVSASESGSLVGLEMVVRENLQRFVAPHNHTGPVWLYVAALPLLIAPWALMLPAALIPSSGGERGSDDRSADRLARVYFWATFAFFTLSASRRNYYLLPIVPAAAMLVARTLTAGPGVLRPSALALRKVGVIASVATLALGGLALVPPSWVLPAPYDLLPPLPRRGLLAAGWLGVPVGGRLRPGPALPEAAVRCRTDDGLPGHGLPVRRRLPGFRGTADAPAVRRRRPRAHRCRGRAVAVPHAGLSVSVQPRRAGSRGCEPGGVARGDPGREGALAGGARALPRGGQGRLCGGGRGEGATVGGGGPAAGQAAAGAGD